MRKDHLYRGGKEGGGPPASLPLLTIENSLPAFGIVSAEQEKRTSNRCGGLQLISRNARSHCHAVQATGILIQLCQHRVQYVCIETAIARRRDREVSIDWIWD